ncbi:MAG: BA14K family protein [Alphaproteobacteria bacterium]|nr:BA14K family protein [Alphaproteobacteria bacterium]
MKRIVVPGLALLALSAGLAVPAMADRAAYCQAYARDFADQRGTDKATWQHKYQIALDSCLAQGKPAVKAKEATPAAPAPVPAPKAVEAKAPAPKPVPAAAKPPVAADATAEPAKLTPGTPEWNDYCAKKYTSFNAKTGMYLSHTGVQRHCLVTKDFKG